MMPILDSQTTEVLTHFYNRFKYRVLEDQSQIEQNSLLLTIIKLPVNQLSKSLTDATVDRSSFSEIAVEQLLSFGYIRELDELDHPHRYAITAEGIWHIETSTNQLDIARLLQYFQETKLSFKVSAKPLSGTEKIILFSMIALRNFSANAAMDINAHAVEEHWADIFDACANQLSAINAITRPEWRTSRSGNEHPISYAMAHANDLPQKTKHIYQTLGKKKYFLDIDNEKAQPQARLLFLYKSIMGHIASKEAAMSAHQFFCDLAYDKTKNVRDGFEYVTPEWDSVLKESLHQFYYEG